ncbi:uncharacterized protein L969DRAFT_95728 [Mixia osmundae IAM 14324]|uniref:Uncharacterized protein n=1 Tax=Mixia osmundae (strain CBS 9802 / IAM 14324 / JCM 22182 / KY 12970) TaxID=764103 RepID=G7E0N8_MIXOS|nr:uncharacterized protein L969DRAFT_95728 [Mixia osmundae IAM 14324]KEI37874.1 hypothetical protein L969DRAFT_95728 [Mixia osmundae IAM 14324]GAA96398.1 hypothetical protein E5Q_03065 [Mixia osmundae IAM 14324]
MLLSPILTVLSISIVANAVHQNDVESTITSVFYRLRATATTLCFRTGATLIGPGQVDVTILTNGGSGIVYRAANYVNSNDLVVSSVEYDEAIKPAFAAIHFNVVTSGASQPNWRVADQTCCIVNSRVTVIIGIMPDTRGQIIRSLAKSYMDCGGSFSPQPHRCPPEHFTVDCKAGVGQVEIVPEQPPKMIQYDIKASASGFCNIHQKGSPWAITSETTLASPIITVVILSKQYRDDLWSQFAFFNSEGLAVLKFDSVEPDLLVTYVQFRQRGRFEPVWSADNQQCCIALLIGYIGFGITERRFTIVDEPNLTVACPPSELQKPYCGAADFEQLTGQSDLATAGPTVLGPGALEILFLTDNGADPIFRTLSLVNTGDVISFGTRYDEANWPSTAVLKFSLTGSGLAQTGWVERDRICCTPKSWITVDIGVVRETNDIMRNVRVQTSISCGGASAAVPTRCPRQSFSVSCTPVSSEIKQEPAEEPSIMLYDLVASSNADCDVWRQGYAQAGSRYTTLYSSAVTIAIISKVYKASGQIYVEGAYFGSNIHIPITPIEVMGDHVIAELQFREPGFKQSSWMSPDRTCCSALLTTRLAFGMKQDSFMYLRSDVMSIACPPNKLAERTPACKKAYTGSGSYACKNVKTLVEREKGGETQ